MPDSANGSSRHRSGFPGRAVVLFASVAAAVTLVASLFIPRVYESQAAVSFSVSTQQVSSQQVTLQLLSGLPSPGALAQAFTQRLETRAFSAVLEEPRPARFFEARYDEKKGLFTLKARGSTPAGAKQRADKLLAVAESYLQERLVTAARTSVASSLEQARLDLTTGEQILRDTREMLKSVPARGGKASPAVAAGLEALKIDPAIARSPNPAITYLSLQEAQLATQVATARARTQAMEGVLKDPASLSRLVGQALQLQVLAPPAEPVRPSSPKPALWALIAGFAAFVVGSIVTVLRQEAAGNLS